MIHSLSLRILEQLLRKKVNTGACPKLFVESLCSVVTLTGVRWRRLELDPKLHTELLYSTTDVFPGAMTVNLVERIAGLKFSFRHVLNYVLRQIQFLIEEKYIGLGSE